MRRFTTQSGCVHVFEAVEYHGRNLHRMHCGRVDWRQAWRETAQEPTCAICLAHVALSEARTAMDDAIAASEQLAEMLKGE